MNSLFSYDFSSDFSSLSREQGGEKWRDTDIAIIGLSARMPRASNYREFWRNTVNRVDTVQDFPDLRCKDIRSYMDHSYGGQDNIIFEKASYLDRIDCFDYGFFGISPNEAKLLDPNQRLFLETAFQAFEDAGYGGDMLKGSNTGIFLGSEGGSCYQDIISCVDPDQLPYSVVGNISSVIAARIAHLLDLRGPSMMVDTACSSSLVAVHVACNALKNQDCSCALIGGIRLYLVPVRKTLLGTESKTGVTKSFSNDADGLGAGEGVVAMLLKPLRSAVEDRDYIHAVIRSTAVNQDGLSVGISAPNAVAQESLLVKAWQKAGIQPSELGYIEVHGSGTPLGDAVEIEGITRAFRQFTNQKQFCAVSSLKTQYGHLDTAAGIAGMLRAVLALKHKRIPPNCHFDYANKDIDFIRSPVYINSETREWKSLCKTRYCAVSSFGLSGTNCHVVLESPEEYQTEKRVEQASPCLFTLSAVTLEVLQALLAEYVAWEPVIRTYQLQDICYTANTGRSRYECRLAITVDSVNQLILQIKQLVADWEQGIGQETVAFSYEKKRAGAQKALINGSPGPLQEIKDAFLFGETVEWDKLFQLQKCKRVSLPAYSFDKTRAWIEKPVGHTPHTQFFTTKWEPANMAESRRESVERLQTAVVFTDDKTDINEFTEGLSKVYREVKCIAVGSKGTDPNKTYVCTQRDYDKLFETWKKDHVQIVSVFHTVSWHMVQPHQEEYHLTQSMEQAYISLFRMVKSVFQAKIPTIKNMYLITGYAHRVDGTEMAVNPVNAALIGLAKSCVWEYPSIVTKCIDTDENTKTQTVLEEVFGSSTEFKIAYRNGRRLKEVFENADLSAQKGPDTDICEDGVYIITGGTGRIGLEIAEYIASVAKTTLILLSRTKYTRDHMAAGQNGTDKRMQNMAQKLASIQNHGSVVALWQADVTKPQEITEIFKLAVERYGKVNGVIHSAGVGIGEEGYTVEEEEEHIVRQVMAPKVEGAWNVAKLANQYARDFIVYFSSAVTLVGASRGADYIAANTFLDALPFCFPNHRLKQLTVGWPVWEKSDFTAAYMHDESTQLIYPIGSNEAMNAFHVALQSAQGQTFVGEINQESRLFLLGDLLPFQISDTMRASGDQKNVTARRLKVSLSGGANVEYSQTEKKLAEIWSDVLGYDSFDIRDNFFEIGGDSILLKKLYAEIDKVYENCIQLADLFAYPTIESLSDFITKSPTNSQVESQPYRDVLLEDLVDELETGALSIEDALRLL